MANIASKASDIRTKVYGEEVRESLASGIEAINDEVVSTTGRQQGLETSFNGLIINAGNSNAEIVDARLGETTLKAKLQKVDASLEEKATKVDVQQISLSYKESYGTLALLQSAYPTGNIYNHAVSADGMIYTYYNSAWISTGIQANGTGIVNFSLTADKFAFPIAPALKSKNLFNKDTVTVGYLVNYLNGVLTVNANCNASDFIAITGSTLYKISGTYEQLAFYNSSKVYISGMSSTTLNAFTTPATACYIRTTNQLAELPNVQLELGSVATTYESFNPKFDQSTIKTFITTDKLEPMLLKGVPSKNLFNKLTVTVGKYINYLNGALATLSGGNASDYIAITGSTVYIVSGTYEQLAFYDVNKVYISGRTSGTAGFTTPTNACYVRLTVMNATLATTQLELGSTVTIYESFGTKFDRTSIPKDIVVRKIIKKDGTGDYLSPKLANDAITDASSSKVYDLIIYPGEYTEIEWVLKDYINLIGIDRDTCILKGVQPSNSLDADISANSTIRIENNSIVKNLKITCKNMRYPVHTDQNGLNKDKTIKLYNCWIEHYGNQDVIDYRIANSQSYSGVWASNSAWGYGSASGMNQYFEDCWFISEQYAWYVHTNLNFDNPSYHELKNCHLVAPKGNALFVASLGSGKNDKVVLNNCELTGLITCADSPWFPTTIFNADHNEIKITGGGNSCAPQINAGYGCCLKILSSSTTDSKVLVSGDAVAVIFGSTKLFNGKAGLNGYIIGSLDISGVNVLSLLGKRLGDCTTVNKTLTITIDANTPVTITFNANYTAMTNAQILSLINTAIGSQGVASVYELSKDYVPLFCDEIKNYYNSSAVGIPKGSVVCYNANFSNIRIMTNADDISLFAGITMEDINPSTIGKVKIKGYIYKNFLKLDDTLVFGNKYGVSTTAGNIKLNGTPIIGKCLYADYLYIEA